MWLHRIFGGGQRQGAAGVGTGHRIGRSPSTSLIRQSVSSNRFDFKNASADVNWSTAYPRVKLAVAWRNGSLSSTIAITGIDNLAFRVRNSEKDIAC
jgi:hypothetical protein